MHRLKSRLLTSTQLNNTELNKTVADQKKCIAENESKISSREKEFMYSKDALQNKIEKIQD